MKTSYRAVIKCDADGDGQDEYYEMDVTNPVNENLSVDITQHPLVEGGMLGDHMFVQPMTIQLSGKFSNVGAKPTSYEGEFGRLANIQTLFERMLKNGTVCSVIHMSKAEGENAKVKFVERPNMVLNNIGWTESQVLDASLGFVEVQTVDLTRVEYDPDFDRDPNLPDLTEGMTLDFTDTYLDWDKINEMVIKMCSDCKIITEGFLEVYITFNDAKYHMAIISAIIGGAIAVGTILYAYTVGLAAAASVFPVGTIVAAAAAIISLALAGIFALVSENARKKKYKVQQFKKYNTDRENQAEVSRFNNFIGQIHTQIEKLEDVIKVYGISKNATQECLLYIDNNYYVFSFEKNNQTGKWGLKVKDAVNEEQLIAEQSQLTGLTSIYDCTTSNMLFRTRGSGFYVYIMNPSQADVDTNTYDQNSSSEETRVEKLNQVEDDLTKYQILISQINLEDFTQVLKDVIKNALEY